mmetsp:Transcript_3034/g.4918  ORF Transcript_3034/g.4918 Transcript_3034/m.4918 type:complete len:460 (-) Transcript_3034:173-1552(-)
MTVAKDKVSAELKAAQEQIDKLKSCLNDLHEEREQTDERLRNSLEQLEEAGQTVQKMCSTSEDVLTSLEDNLHNTLNLAAANLEQLTLDNAGLKKQAEYLTDETKKLQGEILEKGSAWEKAVQEKEDSAKQIQEQSAHVTKLQHEIKEQHEKHSKEIAEAHRNNQDYFQKTMASVKDEANQEKVKLEQQIQELQEQNKQIELLKKENEEQVTKLKVLEATQKDMENQIKQEAKKCKEAEEGKETLEAEIQGGQEMVKQLKQERQKLQQQLSEQKVMHANTLQGKQEERIRQHASQGLANKKQPSNSQRKEWPISSSISKQTHSTDEDSDSDSIPAKKPRTPSSYAPHLKAKKPLSQASTSQLQKPRPQSASQKLQKGNIVDSQNRKRKGLESGGKFSEPRTPGYGSGARSQTPGRGQFRGDSSETAKMRRINSMSIPAKKPSKTSPANSEHSVDIFAFN